MLIEGLESEFKPSNYIKPKRNAINILEYNRVGILYFERWFMRCRTYVIANINSRS